MREIFDAKDGPDRLRLFHHGYITTGEIGDGRGFQLDLESARELVAAIRQWVADDYDGAEVIDRPGERDEERMQSADPLADATQNCPRCLQPMEPAESGWVCPSCSVDDLIESI